MDSDPRLTTEAVLERKPTIADINFLEKKTNEARVRTGWQMRKLHSEIASAAHQSEEAVKQVFYRFRSGRAFFPAWYRPALRSILGIDKFPSEADEDDPPNASDEPLTEIKRLLLCDGWPDNKIEYLEKSVSRGWERDGDCVTKGRSLHVITAFCDGKCSEDNPGRQIKLQLAEYPSDADPDFSIHAFSSGEPPCVFQISGDRVVPLHKVSKTGCVFRPLLSPVGVLVVAAGYKNRMNRFFFNGMRGDIQEYRGWAVIWNSDYCPEDCEMKQTYVTASQNDTDLSIVNCWEIQRGGKSVPFKSIGLASNKAKEPIKRINQLYDASAKLHQLLKKTYLGEGQYRQIIDDLATRKFFPRHAGVVMDERDGPVRNLLYITASTKMPQSGMEK